MILNVKGWHHLAVKKISSLLRKITSKYDDGIYYQNCVHSFATENKRGAHKKVCGKKNVKKKFKINI